MLDAEQINNWQDVLVDTGTDDFPSLYPNTMWPDSHPGHQVYKVADPDTSMAVVAQAGLDAWLELGRPLRIMAGGAFLVFNDTLDTVEKALHDQNIRNGIATLR